MDETLINECENEEYQFNEDSIQPEQIHISITRSSSEMVVMWVTRKHTNKPICIYSVVKPLHLTEDSDECLTGTEFTTSATSKFVTIGKWKATIYCLTIKDLRPYTMYCYRVGDEETGVFSQKYSFNTRHYGAFPFTMVTFADFMVTEEVAKQKQVIKRLVENLAQFDIILEFGDICYAGCFCCCFCDIFTITKSIPILTKTTNLSLYKPVLLTLILDGLTH